MASPQLENGYVKIANEIMDALCKCDPGGSESQILWAIMRKTFGWNKKCDKISISQLSDYTGLARRTVIYALKNLEAKNMITIVRSRLDDLNEVNSISFQKDFNMWVVQEMDGSARKCKSYKATIEKQKENYKNKHASRVVQEMEGSARSGGVVQEMEGSARKCNGKCKSYKVTIQKQKENYGGVVQEMEGSARSGGVVPFLAPTKDTIKNKRKNLFVDAQNSGPKTGFLFLSDSIEIRLGDFLFKHARRNNPNFKQPDLQKWARVFDLMIRIDKRDPNHIRKVIEFCQKDSFWMTNILSAKKLRDKYDQLTLKMGITGTAGILPTIPGNGMQQFIAED